MKDFRRLCYESAVRKYFVKLKQGSWPDESSDILVFRSGRSCIYFLITQQRVIDNIFHLLLSGCGHWFCTIFVASLPGNWVLDSRFDTRYCWEMMRETCCLFCAALWIFHFFAHVHLSASLLDNFPPLFGPYSDQVWRIARMWSTQ